MRTDAAGAQVWEGSGSRVEGAPAVQLVVPLDAPRLAHELRIESRDRSVHLVIGVAPPA
jgi:hypothetical protein